MKDKFDNTIKKVCAIHDLSCLGGAALSEVIPILSTFGIRTNPVPTVILSNHSDYEKYTYHDLTDHMIEQKEMWKEIGVKFDAIFSGFLGSPEQISIVEEYIKDFSKEDTIIVVDPVMGDDGKRYSSVSKDMEDEMKKLVSFADVITPNWTEACILSELDYTDNPKDEELKKVLSGLKALGANDVIITSYPKEKNLITTIIDLNEEVIELTNNRYDIKFPGTGDAFARTLVGALLTGHDLIESSKIASDFMDYAINFSSKYEYSYRQGVLLEACLDYLRKHI